LDCDDKTNEIKDDVTKDITNNRGILNNFIFILLFLVIKNEPAIKESGTRNRNLGNALGSNEILGEITKTIDIRLINTKRCSIFFMDIDYYT
jgi:hypothetical protein